MQNATSSPEPTVYVCQSTDKFGIEKAARFGRLEGLLPEDRNIVLSTQPVLRELKRKLKNFNDRDFLLLVGDPVAIAMATTVAAQVNSGRVRFLKFDRKRQDYYEVTCDFHDKMKREEDFDQ